MKYNIEKIDDLYCVYKWDKIGWRIIAAYEKLSDANNKIAELHSKKEKED